MTYEQGFLYGAGTGTVIAAIDVAVLVETGTGDPLVAECWNALSVGVEFDELLEIILARGLRSVGSFAILDHRGEGRLLMRGQVAAEVTRADDTLVLDRSGSWQEVDGLGSAGRVSVQLTGQSSGSTLPVVIGIVAAGSLSSGEFSMGPAAHEPFGEASDPMDPVEGEIATVLAPAPPPTPAQAVPTPPAPTVDEDDEVEDFSHLFVATTLAEPLRAAAAYEEGRTEPVSPEATLPGDPEESGGSPQPPVTADHVTSGSLTLPPFATSDRPGPKSGGPLIEAVPWQSDQSAARPAVIPDEIGQPPAGPNPVDPLRPGGGLTIDRSRLRPGIDRVDGPLVLAVRCPRGHLSPANAVACRVCGDTVASRERFEIARPTLGRLVLPTGDEVLLDRGVVLGRDPRLPDNWVGPQPNLIELADPTSEISGQHLEIRLELWLVLVTDLGSTNGTVIIDRDGRAKQLHPGEPCVVEPGSHIVLAEVMSIAFEAVP